MLLFSFSSATPATISIPEIMFGKTKKNKKPIPSAPKSLEVSELSKNAKMAYQTPDCRITGTIKFDGAMRVDGKVDGEIITDNGDLVVGEAGTVKADINTKSASIEGRVNGKITASDKVVLKQKARLIGDLQAKTLVVEEGVVFSGRCNVKP